MANLDILPHGSTTEAISAADPVRSDSAQSPDDPPPLADLSPWLRDSPPWLASAVVHMLLMIILGLVFLQQTSEPSLLLNAGYSEDVGDPLEEDVDLTESPFELEDYELTPENIPIVEDPFSLPTFNDMAADPVMPVGPISPMAIGVELSGRTPGMKEALLKAFGGNQQTELAVMLGLEWLASRQKNNGMWSLTGPYPDGARSENDEAATAMALLAFQGAGYTHEGDPKHEFTKVVRDGWYALLKSLDDDGRFFRDVPRSHQLYTQAQCTIALCELYAMTGDKDYFEPAQRAVDYCVNNQAPEGGWRYSPGNDSDMSVTGWFVMALQSARMAGIEVPSPTIDRIKRFLDSVADNDGSRYAYRPRQGATLPLTAEGLLCRQYLGWGRNDPRLASGVEVLTDNLPAWDQRNVYYWYYATQVLHHMEGDPWRLWNEEMRRMLPEQQVRRGRERGSWDPLGDRWGSAGGRLYVTCLSLYILEVYYRHLPIYRTGNLSVGM